jgi:hypothetical protein
MIMAMENGGERRPTRRANHPWNHPQLRLTANDEVTETRCCKVTMTVTKTELLAIRSRAKGDSVSEFLRQHFPAELLLPVDHNQEA